MRVSVPLFSLFLIASCGPAQTNAPPPPPPPAAMAPPPAVAPEAPPAGSAAAPSSPGPGVGPAPQAPAPPTAGPDPLVVGPNIYKFVFENERIRILEVSFKPGDEIATHAHPDHVVYVLAGGKLKIMPTTGPAQDADLKVGSGMFLPAQSHSAKNVGKTPIKLVVLEIKPGNTPGAAPPGEDPVKAGPKIYKKMFEDEHVRVLQITFEKGAKIPMHSHPDHAVYVTSAGKLKITPAQGAAQEVDLKEGSAVFLPAQAHSAENAGNTKVQAIVFEIKGAKASAK